MPAYDFRCTECEEVFEVKQSFSDSPLTEHEGCGGTVERLISPPALQFKGSGWYITDSRNGGSSSSSESKSDTKSSSSD